VVLLCFPLYLGNTLAEYFNTGDNNLDIARLAENLAPKDPITHWRLGRSRKRNFQSINLPLALVEFEQAVALSPNDYRFWMFVGYGFVNKQMSRKKAEAALRHAITLAPSYAYRIGISAICYYAANVTTKPFMNSALPVTEIRRCCVRSCSIWFWAVYGNEPEGLAKAVGPNAETRASFALFLDSQQKYDEG